MNKLDLTSPNLGLYAHATQEIPASAQEAAESAVGCRYVLDGQRIALRKYLGDEDCVGKLLYVDPSVIEQVVAEQNTGDQRVVPATRDDVLRTYDNALENLGKVVESIVTFG